MKYETIIILFKVLGELENAIMVYQYILSKHES